MSAAGRWLLRVQGERRFDVHGQMLLRMLPQGAARATGPWRRASDVLPFVQRFTPQLYNHARTLQVCPRRLAEATRTGRRPGYCRPAIPASARRGGRVGDRHLARAPRAVVALTGRPHVHGPRETVDRYSRQGPGGALRRGRVRRIRANLWAAAPDGADCFDRARCLLRGRHQGGVRRWRPREGGRAT